LMRRDHQPDRIPLSASGFPKPECGVRSTFVSSQFILVMIFGLTATQ
jgi:hypothetical protein